MLHEDKQLENVEKVDSMVLPMVQDKIVTIPHIGFVIPKLFNDVVEYKVFLFSKLPKVIPDLKFSTSKLEVEFSPNKGECCKMQIGGFYL